MYNGNTQNMTVYLCINFQDGNLVNMSLHETQFIPQYRYHSFNENKIIIIYFCIIYIKWNFFILLYPRFFYLREDIFIFFSDK